MKMISSMRKNKHLYNKVFVGIGILLIVFSLLELPSIFNGAFHQSLSRLAFTNVRVYQSEYFGSTVLFPFFARLLGALSLFFYGLFLLLYHPYNIEWMEHYIKNDKAIRLVAILVTPFTFWYAIRQSESYLLK